MPNLRVSLRSTAPGADGLQSPDNGAQAGGVVARHLRRTPADLVVM